MDYSEDIEKATFVSITFEFQKNRDKRQTIFQQCTGLHLCPVKCWARLSKRVLSYSGSSHSSPINLAEIGGKVAQITNKNVISHLRTTVGSIGEKWLGFTKSEVGTHSLRSLAGMALFLTKVRGSCPIFAKF